VSAGTPDGRDLPLMRWGEELRQRKATRSQSVVRGVATGTLCTLVVASALVAPSPHLVWNASNSAPVGLYHVAPMHVLRRGDMVVARLAPAVARLAASRGYLPIGVPVVKRVAGMPGDHICADRLLVSINGRPAAARLAADSRGRRLPIWHGCITLDDRQYLLLNESLRSFDGRYFGPTDASAIVGLATPLWLR
jgi:conjugative transfer signal peptidase TraF